MTITLKCKLLFFCVISISAENIDNPCLVMRKFAKNYECYEENNKPCSESCSNGEINWRLTNSTLGLVEVEFYPCGIGYFHIKLYVRETEENTCDLNGEWKVHSVYNYNRRMRNNQDNSPKCLNVAKIQLEYVFSGCYKFEIETKDGYCEHKYHLKYLTTNYVKYLFKKESITTERQQRFTDNKTYLVTKFNYPVYLQNTQFCFKLENEDSKERLFWNVSCPVENIQNFQKDCEITIHGQNNISCSSKAVKIDNNEFIIECDLFGLIPGNYSFENYIVNEPIRCYRQPNSIWGTIPCVWEYSLILPEENILLPNPQPNNSTSIYLIGISILVLISLTLILIYFLHKKIQKNKLRKHIPDVVYNREDSSEDSSDENLIEILLLYARDCEIFMETMSSFRRMLGLYGKIYDVHDPDIYSEILSENDWLSTKIMDKNIKIILVLSECGDNIIQEKKSYKNLKCNDYLYNYGIVLLKNSYRLWDNKLFVVKFSIFEESTKTSILSPDFRYNLDIFDNVCRLLNNLFNVREVDDHSFHLKERIKFNEMCKRLIEFVRLNPNYLEDILKIT